MSTRQSFSAGNSEVIPSSVHERGTSPHPSVPEQESNVVVFERLAALSCGAADFNMSSYKKNLKLQKLIIFSQRNKKPSIGKKARAEGRILKTEALLAQKVDEYLSNRLKKSSLSSQNRYVRLGDEYRLRQAFLIDNIDLNARDITVSRN